MTDEQKRDAIRRLLKSDQIMSDEKEAIVALCGEVMRLHRTIQCFSSATSHALDSIGNVPAAEVEAP